MPINSKTFSIEHLQLKHKNAAQWNADYVLAAGEIGLELDTKKYKLGDGETKWSELDYFTNPTVTALVDALAERVTANESAISSIQTDITDLKSRVKAIEDIDTISVNASPAQGE